MSLKGTLADLGIVDLIQFPHSGRKSGELALRKDDLEAKLYYEDGTLVHAVLGSASGIEALVGVIGWEEGSFEFSPDAPVIKSRTIELDLHRAVMQALKLHDERKLEEAQKAMDQQDGSLNDTEHLRQRLDEYIRSNEFAICAGIFSAGGELLASAGGSEGEAANLEDLKNVLHALIQAYPRSELNRVIINDGMGTVVLARLADGGGLMVVAGKEASLGAVSMSVGRLAGSLE
jgi:hypothetical protein